MAEHAGTEILTHGADKAPRAGRDLPIAIGMGLLLLAVTAASLVFRKAGFILCRRRGSRLRRRNAAIVSPVR